MHCWLRFRFHVWTFIGYRRWPHHELYECARCGEMKVVIRAVQH